MCLFLAGSAFMKADASTHYVDVNNVNPVAPYDSWSTAATSIQDAVNITVAGDTILVTNGVYDSGGTVTPGYSCMNRVVITNNILVQSVHGPEHTFIVGSAATGGGTGSDAVRGIYISEGTLSGFTITNGHTRISGDSYYARSGGGVSMYGGDGSITNCVISGNSASHGGGGSSHGTLNGCTLTGNSTDNQGGGSYWGSLSNCKLAGNSANKGGGSAYGTLNTCILTANLAEGGGGSIFSTLNNCTVIDNSATLYAGGCDRSALNNCIVYYNTVSGATDNSYSATFNYSCTTPIPSSGTGNIDDEPSLVSVSHISANSPCVAAGTNVYASGTDIDGEEWSSPPSMGCDEPLAPFSGQLSVSISADRTEVSTGTALGFAADITGKPASNQWTFGDGESMSNTIYPSHTWQDPGNYKVELTAWNNSYPNGISDSIYVQVLATNVHYVNAANASPTFPYTNWTTAANNIQDAIDAAVRGNVVLVTNGIYNSGGAVTPDHSCMNRVVITDDIQVKSVNGPETTFIVGEGPLGSSAVRGTYMSAGMLSGFTITNGHTEASGDSNYDTVGGGVNLFGGDGIVSNCVLSGNSAHIGGGGSYHGTLTHCTLVGNSGPAGGGSFRGTLYNTLFVGNSAQEGGGSNSSILNNCTLFGNSALRGGGSSYGTLVNCIVYGNSSTSGSYSNFYDGTFSYSCTTPLPTGENNITNNPFFMDTASGNYRLIPVSPCIDNGINQDWMFGAVDLKGIPRIFNGTVDMGAYETPFTLNVRAILQGPYNSSMHTMVEGNPATIPLASPYASDPQTALEIPSNAVDWVLVELLDTNKTTLVSKSAFLDTNGQLISTDGGNGITAEVSSGDYFVVVKHRNHLAAMSAQAVAFTNILIFYDFTTGADKYAE